MIQSGDLDWEKSRPLTPWFVRRGAFSIRGYWHLAWIELSKTDLSRVFFGRGDAPTAGSEEGVPADQSGSQPKGNWPRARTETARRGPEATKFNATVTAMRNHIRQGQLTVAQLEGMLEKDLAANYGVSRDTARKARNTVLSELNSRQNPTNDK